MLRRRTLCSARLSTVSIPQPFRIVREMSIASQIERGAGRSGPSLPPSLSVVLRVDVAVGVEDVLLGRTLVEVLVALGGLIEGDDRGVDGVGDVGLVVQDAHHQAAVVLLDRALTGEEGVALGPTESETDLERTLLSVRVRRAGIAGHVQAGNAERAAGPRDGLHGV